MNIEEELLHDAGEAMAKSIDFDILCDMLIPLGYTMVKVEYSPERKWIDVMSWVDENCSGRFQEHNGKWLFARPKDATMFTLRWT